MAKDLPYFKFNVSEWSDGDITLESYAVQGVFINVCSYFWSNECLVSKEKIYRKFKDCHQELDRLFDAGILKESGDIVINFLNKQLDERNELSFKNSKNAKKRWSEKPNECDRNATASDSQSQNHAIKSRVEKSRDNISVNWDVFIEQFNELSGKNIRVVDKKARKQLIDRLKEGFSKDDVANAIYNCANDPYHIEHNLKYLTPEFITRADKLSKYCSIQQTSKKSVPLSQTPDAL